MRLLTFRRGRHVRAARRVCGAAAFVAALGGVFAASADDGADALSADGGRGATALPASAVSDTLPAFDSFAAARASAVVSGGFHSFVSAARTSEDALAKFDSTEPRGLYITVR